MSKQPAFMGELQGNAPGVGLGPGGPVLALDLALELAEPRVALGSKNGAAGPSQRPRCSGRSPSGSLKMGASVASSTQTTSAFPFKVAREQALGRKTVPSELVVGEDVTEIEIRGVILPAELAEELTDP